MSEPNQTLHVQITTARGNVFSDWVDGAEIETADGSIRLVPNEHSYLSFSGASRLSLRQGSAYISFHLRNSAAHVDPQQLRIVAEEARQDDTDKPASAKEDFFTI